MSNGFDVGELKWGDAVLNAGLGIVIGEGVGYVSKPFGKFLSNMKKKFLPLPKAAIADVTGEVTEEIVEEVVEETIEEVVEVSTEKLVKETVEETFEEVVEETFEEAVEDVSVQPVKSFSELMDPLEAKRYDDYWDSFILKDVDEVVEETFEEALEESLEEVGIQPVKSFSELMDPSEAKRYNDYWDELDFELNGIANSDRLKSLNLLNAREIMKADLDEFRKVLSKSKDAKNVKKICSTIDIGNTNLRRKAGSGIWAYNPTIIDHRGLDPRTFCKTPEDFSRYYRGLLSDEYIDDLPEDFFIGKNKECLKENMAKLRAKIEQVKADARALGKINQYNEPGFEKDWNVDNCAEIWSARDLILKNGKFDDFVIRTENKAGGFAKPCKNCSKTFFGFYNIDD